MKYQINPNVLSSKIDEEAILMCIEADAYFGLDPIATRIWDILSEKPQSLDGIVAILSEEYEVDQTTCETDVKAFLTTMIERKLISEVA